jgi:prepilin-type N-terminal cleavage/methylation domain-containing protein
MRNYQFNKKNHFDAGFTLIELMIVVAIIGILAAVAIPSYQNYVRRAAYGEVILAMAPFKVGVTDCFQTNGALATCNSGADGVPAAFTSASGPLATVRASAGVITVTTNAYKGITASDGCSLNPLVVASTLRWSYSGNCLTNGFVKN